MKREILFRGFNEKNSKWLYGYYFVNRGEHFVADDEIQTSPLTHWTDLEVDPNTIGQYTGVKDKNGNKIFEGDVVSYRTYDGFCRKRQYEGVVEWTNDLGFMVESLDGTRERVEWVARQEEATVIGNIYDDVGLLNE